MGDGAENVAALSPYLSKFHDKKVWMPFYYDGEAGKRLKATGFRRVVHKREDFFKRVNDRVFVNSVDVVVDNPPYTGKGMKERVLKALVEADVPFCLLLPLGVLHGAMVRETLDRRHVQCLIPRRCWVSNARRRRGAVQISRLAVLQAGPRSRPRPHARHVRGGFVGRGRASRV